jgi:hypothetical protein
VQTLSDELGYYGLELATGSHSLCTAFYRCAAIEVPAGAPLDESYEFSGDNWFTR